jgi:hypothetical protein
MKNNNSEKLVINESTFADGLTGFSNGYRAINMNVASVIKIRYDQTFRNIFTMSGFALSFDGLVFHYGINSSSTEQSLCYLISLGKKLDNGMFSVHQFPASGQEYFELRMGSNTILPCSANDFNTKTRAYWCNMERLDIDTNTFESLNDADEDPRMVFHPTNELEAFNREYEPSISQRYLYIYHGARINRPHTPMFRFGDEDREYEIDDIDYESRFGYDFRYRNKAFNIGQLCPPGCNSVAPICSPAS